MIAMIFGMGAMEILLICGIALLVLGPRKLPELAGKLGRTFGELKGAASDFKHEFERAQLELEQPPEPRHAQPNAGRSVKADPPAPEEAADAPPEASAGEASETEPRREG